jgi:hypothetical protein
MSKPILFTLKPNFTENGRAYYCPDCATVEGVLSYHPEVRAQLDVRPVDFARPRPAVIELIGAENQGCPVLILPDGSATPAAEVHPRTANGQTFIAGARDITTYLALTMGSTFPH